MGEKHFFILRIWIIYFILEIFLSNAFPLIDSLIESNEINSIFLIFSLKYSCWIGIVVGLLVFFKIKLRYTLALFIFLFLYVNYGTYVAIGSYGYWVFFTFPLAILYFSIFDNQLDEKLTDHLLKASYALFYFFAGFAKVFPIWQLPEWLSGYTIINLLKSRQPLSVLYNDFGIDIFMTFDLFIIQTGILFSVILELSAILIIFYPRFSLIFIPLILSFHFFLFLTGTPGIVVYFFAALIFIPENLYKQILYFQSKIYKLI